MACIYMYIVNHIVSHIASHKNDKTHAFASNYIYTYMYMYTFKCNAYMYIGQADPYHFVLIFNECILHYTDINPHACTMY